MNYIPGSPAGSNYGSNTNNEPHNDEGVIEMIDALISEKKVSKNEIKEQINYSEKQYKLTATKAKELRNKVNQSGGRRKRSTRRKTRHGKKRSLRKTNRKHKSRHHKRSNKSRKH